MRSLSRRLARLSADEMVSALGLHSGPAWLRAGLGLPFYAASRQLGEILAELDAAIGQRSLPLAAGRALERFGVALITAGVPLAPGPQLVLANHPGAYDALGLVSALGRADLKILAADRSFLRALPQLSTQLLFVGDQPGARASALKRALRHLRQGGALLHFPAGQIEPDADFEHAGRPLLAAWQPGVNALVAACARANGRVAVAGVRGVHSPRAKRWRLNRWAERRGVTTLAPLLQMVAGLHDVGMQVRAVDVGDARSLQGLAPDALHAQLRATLTQVLAVASAAPTAAPVDYNEIAEASRAPSMR